MPYLLMGYDVEIGDVETDTTLQENALFNGPESIELFTNAIIDIHQKHHSPCTLYITGNTIRKYRKCFQMLRGNPLFNMESHTFEHTRFKTVIDRSLDGKYTMFEGGSLMDIAVSVGKNKILIEEFFETECIGICTPFGYYKGLSDRPDLLAMLHKQGVRFVRSYGRNSEDQSPVSIDIQPYWYEVQGFPDILEIPFHGWIDCHYRRLVGYEDWGSYVEETKKWIDMAVEKNVDLSLCQHDWTSVLYDPQMKHTAEILRYANEKGLQPVTSREYYLRKVEEKKQLENNAG